MAPRYFRGWIDTLSVGREGWVCGGFAQRADMWTLNPHSHSLTHSLTPTPKVFLKLASTSAGIDFSARVACARVRVCACCRRRLRCSVQGYLPGVRNPPPHTHTPPAYPPPGARKCTHAHSRTHAHTRTHARALACARAHTQARAQKHTYTRTRVRKSPPHPPLNPALNSYSP